MMIIGIMKAEIRRQKLIDTNKRKKGFRGVYG